MQGFAKRVIKNRLAVTRNSRKSLLPKQVFSIILSLMVFNCYNLLIFYYISQRCFWKLFVFPLGTSRSLFIWTSSTFFPPPNFIFAFLFLFFFNMSVLILTLSNPSCHSGFVWRILTVRAKQTDPLRVKVIPLSLSTRVPLKEVIQVFVTPEKLPFRPVLVWVLYIPFRNNL